MSRNHEASPGDGPAAVGDTGPWRPGKVHIYTGNGKGKTTAALGLALRALGAGWPVFLGHFIKAGPTSEHKALEKFAPRMAVECFGRGRWIGETPSAKDTTAAEKGLIRSREVLASKRFRLVILDEVLVAAARGLVSEANLLDLLQARPEPVELVLTGRGATERMMAAADLVTEMREIKHYFSQGTGARTGIEK